MSAVDTLDVIIERMANAEVRVRNTVKLIGKKVVGKVSLAIMISAISIYCLAVFIETPILSDMRTLWIETAMTTGDHQWLATSIIPKYVIDDVMSKQVNVNDIISITDLKDNAMADDNEETIELEDTYEGNSDKLNQQNLGETDELGNKVIVNDIEQGIVIVEVKGVSYLGRLVFIDDPSRVFVSNTDRKESRGKLILDYLKDTDSIIGINANGFNDPGGQGMGGQIIGASLSGGEEWGYAQKDLNITIGFDDKDRLVVGKIKDWNEYNLRDAAQYQPVLISNGEKLITGTAGWGLQPRTIVGQREDGVVTLLVVDGRKPGYSIGITMGECADLLYEYGVVNAAACDGGSSSILAYNGEIINKPSTPMKTGRYLPNAFLVKRK